jgi:multimeric flavodoxin WrbA
MEDNMKITAVLGSPIRNGNSEEMVNLFLTGFTGDDISIFNINELNCKGCQACDECKKSDSIECALHDELQPAMNSLLESDLIVLASPIYMDQITAQMRIFQDRLNVFLRSDFSTKLKETPTILLFSQAIEDENGYMDYFKTLKKVYGKFNMKVVDMIVLPDASEHDEIKNNSEVQVRLTNWKKNNYRGI